MNLNNPSFDVIICAAGRGTRVGGTCPKQYLSLNGLPILRHSVQTFLAHPAIRNVMVAIHPDDRDDWARLLWTSMVY